MSIMHRLNTANVKNVKLIPKYYLTNRNTCFAKVLIVFREIIALNLLMLKISNNKMLQN